MILFVKKLLTPIFVVLVSQHPMTTLMKYVRPNHQSEYLQF